MNVQGHKKTLGILHIAYGLLIAIVFLFVGSLIAILYPFISSEILDESGKNGEQILALVTSVIQLIFILLLLFSALPSIIAGIGLVLGKSWGVVLGLIAGCVSIFNVPFGTALGIYSIYVFVANNRQANDPNQQ